MSKIFSILIFSTLLLVQVSCAGNDSDSSAIPAPPKAPVEMKDALTNANEGFISRPGCDIKLESPTVERIEEKMRSKYSDREYLTFRFLDGKAEIGDHFITCLGPAPFGCRTTHADKVVFPYVQTREGVMLLAADGSPHAFVSQNKGQDYVTLIGLSADFRQVLAVFAVSELKLKITPCK